MLPVQGCRACAWRLFELSALPREFAGRYTVRTPIGEGAFSVTYRAVDTSLQRDVAIKVLREQYAVHEGFDSRFEREARSAARISHPNVISVYDYGRQGHLPYIVMQYVDGPNLKEYVREEGPLTVEEAINFARQILDGLAAIHDEGIIHRDVKPQNVLIDTGLQAKITDFGVAFVTVDPGLTETGMAVGTAAYMAPEQASGEPVGPQADLYAVGVILYELLTGRLPFPGDNPVQVMYRHVNEMPEPPRSLNRSVPLGVEAVILKALAKDPYDRFPDARTMVDALISPGSAASETIASPTIPPPSPSQSGQYPSAQAPVQRRRQQPRRYAPVPAPRPSLWPVVLLTFVIIGLVIILVLLLQSDRFTAFGASPQATPTEQVAGVVDGDDPTPTEEQAGEPPAVIDEPEPTATEEPAAEPEEPTATPAEPTATMEPEVVEEPPPASEPEGEPEELDTPAEDEDVEDADSSASSQYNTPFDARLLPPEWAGGANASITWEMFQAAGAGDAGGEFPAPGARIRDAVAVEFHAGGAPSAYIGLTLAGMTLPEPGETPMRISLNGNQIWSGPAPFDPGAWTEIGWRIGNLQWVHQGANILTIEVLSTGGPVLISNATVYYG